MARPVIMISYMIDVQTLCQKL